MRRISKRKIFIFLSIVFILGCLIFYGIRMYHFYQLEHPKLEIAEDKTLYGRILKDNDLVQSGDGLYAYNYDFVFKGNVKNNYVYYSGMMFRIVRLSDNRTVRLIADDITTSLVWSYEKDYEESYVYDYLQNHFFNSLNNNDLIAQTYWCIDAVDKKSDVCEKTTFGKVGLLTYDEYKIAGANESYLNINKYWWLINKYKDNKVWYVFNEGGVNNNSINSGTYYSYGVRPVINLKAGLEYVKGDGTKENPYIVVKKEKLGVGTYINYSNYTWKIIEETENSYKLAMNTCLQDENGCIKKSFGKNFNPNDRNTLANYLNNAFFNTLDQSHIVPGTWNMGNYGVDTKYSLDLGADTFEANVGLLNVLENDKQNALTLNFYNKNLINSTKEDGIIYYSGPEDELDIYPVIYIDKNIKVKGKGTLESPFEVGEA